MKTDTESLDELLDSIEQFNQCKLDDVELVEIANKIRAERSQIHDCSTCKTTFFSNECYGCKYNKFYHQASNWQPKGEPK